jgi:hypothetical protein
LARTKFSPAIKSLTSLIYERIYRYVRDDEFERLLGKYLEPSGDPNPEMCGVRIEWVRDNPDFGSRRSMASARRKWSRCFSKCRRWSKPGGIATGRAGRFSGERRGATAGWLSAVKIVRRQLFAI